MPNQTQISFTSHRIFKIAKYLPVLGLLLAAIIVCEPVSLRAQAPNEEPFSLDDKRPLPPIDAKQAELREKFRIKNKDAAIFRGLKNPLTGKIEGGIEDFKPVAAEKDNADEYHAWHEIILHTRQFSTAEAEQFASREAIRDDLLNPPGRFDYRLDLLRFEGKLTKVRRIAATKLLRDAGIAEVYEGLLVPLDEPPNAVISVVFTDLPAELAEVKQTEPEQWREVNTWATVAGYFFKVRQDTPGQEAFPLIIARSVTPSKQVPGVDAEQPTALNKGLRVFRHIKDNTYIAKGDQNWEEVSAWNRVLLHARRFMPEQLEEAAKELKFADLFLDTRSDFKLDLVKFEGRLIMLKQTKATEKLQAAGIENLYEGWIVPKDEPSGHPICVVFTDPPEGVEAVGRVNKWVSFAGYSFKLMWYKSGERDKDDPNQNVIKKTPLLLGRAVIARRDPDAPTSLTWSGFMNGLLAIVVGLLVIGVGVSFWYRKGDRRARKEIDNLRGRNPFNENSAVSG